MSLTQAGDGGSQGEEDIVAFKIESQWDCRLQSARRKDGHSCLSRGAESDVPAESQGGQGQCCGQAQDHGQGRSSCKQSKHTSIWWVYNKSLLCTSLPSREEPGAIG